MFGIRKLRQRIDQLERENADLTEKVHQGWQILDMLTEENVFIWDTSGPSANEGNVLCYLNENARSVLKGMRQDLIKDFRLDPDRIMGVRMHDYFKDSQGTPEILLKLKPGETHRHNDFQVGSHTIRSVSHPLTSHKGKVVGIVTTWVDVGGEKKTEITGQSNISELVTVAAAMEEMTATTEEVARNTRQVSDMSTEAMHHAETGEKVMENLVTGMTGIGETVSTTAEAIRKLGQRSSDIGKIIEVINDIADQTNMLALNAAIEAARAGEQGRGFAVVADEVRKLAERTTKATKEIAATIKATQEETDKAVTSMVRGTEDVEKGKILVAEVSKTLHQILADSKKVTDLMLHIASATEEQSRTVQEISENVENLAKT